jgi:hypothetical protein
MKMTLGQLIDEICGSNTGLDLGGFEDYEVRVPRNPDDSFGEPAELLDVDAGSKTIWIGLS